MVSPINLLFVRILLVVVLIAQASVGISAWHIDLPNGEDSDDHNYCALVVMHEDTHHGADEPIEDEHHHHHHCSNNVQSSTNSACHLGGLVQRSTIAVIAPPAHEIYQNPNKNTLYRPPIT